jgi:hypothetical protein
MIESFIDSVLIIDDSKSEVEKLEQYFLTNDIRVNHFTPEELEKKTDFFKNRKLIIVDLYLVDSDTLTNNIARIRKYFKNNIGKTFGNYGLVLWTKHLEHLNEFRDKIKLDQSSYSLPLFIIGLDKTKYLAAGNYNTVVQDLVTEIEKNAGASFFVKWNNLVKTGRDNATNQIFDLVKDYNKQDTDLKFILLKLAHNYTGIPIAKSNEHSLEHDAIKAMSDILHYEITNSFGSKSNLFDKIEEIKFSGSPEDEYKVFGDLNSRLLLDFTNNNQQAVLPGNIYEIIKEDNSYIIEDVSFKENKKIVTSKSKTTFKNVKNIILEVTPPCDFAQDKKANRSRFISGLIFDYEKEAKKYFTGEGFYTELFPIKLPNEENLKMIVFDFKFFSSLNEDELKKPELHKILFRVKDKLFADVLQKLSSHTARLGLPIIH